MNEILLIRLGSYSLVVIKDMINLFIILIGDYVNGYIGKRE